MNLQLQKDRLELICKVWNPSLSINFYFYDELIARCLTFPTVKCDCYNNNSQIDFNRYTNETRLEIFEISIINGNWTCKHGVSKNDQAATVGINLGMLLFAKYLKENIDFELNFESKITSKNLYFKLHMIDTSKQKSLLKVPYQMVNSIASIVICLV